MRKTHIADRLLLFAAVLFLLTGLFCGCVYAEYDQVILSDGADLLTDFEEADLIEQAEELADLTGWDIRMVTTEDAEGKEAIEYIEDFYMDHYNQDDGIGCLIDMDNREIRMATSGKAILYLTDSRIDDILDEAFDAVSGGDYADCFSEMLYGAADAFREGIPSGQYTYDEDTGEVTRYRAPKKITLSEALIALGLGIIVMVLFCVFVTGRYRMRFGKYKFRLHENSSVELTEKTDQFVRRNVISRHIPRNNNRGGGGFPGGGRSTVHHGSGGHSFGGGGRKF